MVITQIWLLLLGGLGLGGLLDVWTGHKFPIIFYLGVGGSLLSYIYSAPHLKLKQNGWIGNFALGSSYISLPWWAGQALFGTLTPDIVILTLLYSIAGLGIAIVNDFKSIEGDRALGLQSLPVAFGVDTAKWICVGAIDITQLSVAADTMYFKVHFEEVPELVASRKVFMLKGYAYVAMNQVASLVVTHFRSHLSKALVLTNRVLA